MKVCGSIVEIFFVVAEVLQENKNADNPTRKARLNPKGTTRPNDQESDSSNQKTKRIFCENSRSRQRGEASKFD
jgi:hypothetical protein